MSEQDMKSCRVCSQPVTPWRRGWRRPTTTIHEHCTTAVCKFCGQTFTVGKERKGLFCRDEHQQEYRREQRQQIRLCDMRRNTRAVA